MKPLNYKERRKALFQFSLVFGVMIIVMFITGYVMLKTGERGVQVLEIKHSRYSEAFRKKAAFTFEIEEIIKRLYQINNKKRSFSQHKKFQDLVSNMRDKITESVKKEEEENVEEFIIYQELVTIIKDIQNDLDTYEEANEKYMNIESLLERCNEKYIEEKEKTNNKR
jgi:gas vesicle protein